MRKHHAGNGGKHPPAPPVEGQLNLIVCPDYVRAIVIGGHIIIEQRPMQWDELLRILIADERLIPAWIVVKVRTLDDMMQRAELRRHIPKGKPS